MKEFSKIGKEVFVNAAEVVFKLAFETSANVIKNHSGILINHKKSPFDLFYAALRVIEKQYTEYAKTSMNLNLSESKEFFSEKQDPIFTKELEEIYEKVAPQYWLTISKNNLN